MTEKHCPHCSGVQLEKKKHVTDDNEIVEEGWICPSCEETFNEDVILDYEEIEFPIWVELEAHRDNYELYKELQWQTDIHESIVDSSKMKYAVSTSWWKIEEGFEVSGPFCEKGEDDD